MGRYPNPRDYVLVPLSLLFGILVLIATVALVIVNFYRDIDKTIAGYAHMASSVEAAVVHEMVQRNERQLMVLETSLDKQAISRGESAFNPTWAIAHQINQVDHFLFFYNKQFDRIDTYPLWDPPSNYRPSERPWYAAITMEGPLPIWFGPYKEYISGDSVLTLIQHVYADTGELLGLLMVDMLFEPLRLALQRTIGNNQVALYLTHRGSDSILVGSHFDLLPDSPREEDKSDWLGFGVLKNGAYIKRELDEVSWDLNLFISADIFRQALRDDLFKMVLPLFIIILIWLSSIALLVRVFRNEQQLVAKSLNQIVDNSKVVNRFAKHKTWFVGQSLSEIDQVRVRFLKGRDAQLRDPLTGILNRRAFEQSKQILERRGEPFWLILFDIDQFKQINDSQGHSFGDQVLCQVARCLVDVLGTTAVFRIGGDEFVALISLEREVLGDTLTRLLTQVRQLQWCEYSLPITLSAGAARYSLLDDALFERADAALYRCKESGRDCWFLAD